MTRRQSALDALRNELKGLTTAEQAEVLRCAEEVRAVVWNSPVAVIALALVIAEISARVYGGGRILRHSGGDDPED